jgi:hypothetical protein
MVCLWYSSYSLLSLPGSWWLWLMVKVKECFCKVGHLSADCLLTTAGSVLVNRSPLLFNGCCKLRLAVRPVACSITLKMSVTRLPQWSSWLFCMIPVIMKVQLEVVCKTVYAVVSLLCAEVMSHVDLNGCIPLSAVKFQSVCYYSLLKGQVYSWVNCVRMSWSFGGLICSPLLLSCRIITCDFKRVQQKVIFDNCFLFKMYWWKVELTHTGQLTLATSELLFLYLSF